MGGRGEKEEDDDEAAEEELKSQSLFWLIVFFPKLDFRRVFAMIQMDIMLELLVGLT